MSVRETHMETQKGPNKDDSPSKRVLYGFHVSLGECKLRVGFGIHYDPLDNPAP